MARLKEAWSDFYTTVGPGEVRRTDTAICSVIQGNACATVLAGVGSARVGGGKFTVSTNKTIGAIAEKVSNIIHTCATILTYDIDTVIDVSLAALPSETISAETLDKTRISNTQSSILARYSSTQVHSHLTACSSKIRQTETLKLVDSIKAGPIILTRFGQAFINFSFTELPCEALYTAAIGAALCSNHTHSIILTIILGREAAGIILTETTS